jgi:DNA-binding transcriptional ArsR family regulator
VGFDNQGSFDKYVKDFGFNQFPFYHVTTENELTLREKLFFSPSEYSPIVEAFFHGQTMLILGNRGTGKTAMLYDINSKSEPNILLSWLDDFSALPKPFKEEHFYEILLIKLTEQLFFRLINEKKRIKRLSAEEKTLLVYLLKTFFPTVSKPELMQRIEKISKFWGIPLLKKMYNFSRDFLNYGLSTAIQLSSDAIRQHFTSLPPIPKEFVLRQYFPEIKYVADQEFEKQEISYAFLQRCLSLVKSLGYKNFTLIIDKIDEDSRLQNDAEEIANFIEPVLTDNKLLLNNDLQLIISLWNIPFGFLADRVRSQKHFSTYLRWDRKDLEGALNKRLETYSDNNINDYKTLFSPEVGEDYLQKIFYLANGNPRDLWHIFRYIFYAQFKIDSGNSKIEPRAIIEGFNSFVREFNYYEYYPRKVGSRADSLDVYSYIRHLLRLGKVEFTRNAFQEATGVSGGSVNNYVSQMQRMGLIVESDRKGTTRVYKVVDPKIEYAINNTVNITKVTT